MASRDSSRNPHLHPPAPPPDPEVVRNIEVLACFVAKNGPDFELLARRNTAGNPKFSFLREPQQQQQQQQPPSPSSSLAKSFYEWKKQKLLHRRFESDGSDDLQLKIFMMAQGSSSLPSPALDHGNSFEAVEKKELNSDKIVIAPEKDNSNRKNDHDTHHRAREHLKTPVARNHYESTTAENVSRSGALQTDSAKRSRYSDDSGKRSHQSADSAKWSHQSDDSAKRPPKSDDYAKRPHRSYDSVKRSDQSDDLTRRSDDLPKRSHQSDDSAKRSHQPDDSTKRSLQPSDSAKRSHQSNDSAKRSYHSDDPAKRSHHSDDSAKRSYHSDDLTKRSHQSDESAKRSYQSDDSAKRMHLSDDSARRPPRQSNDSGKIPNQPPHESRDDVKRSSLSADWAAKEPHVRSSETRKDDFRCSSLIVDGEAKKPDLIQAGLTRSNQSSKDDLCSLSTADWGARAPDSTAMGMVMSSQSSKDDLKNNASDAGNEAKEPDLIQDCSIRASPSSKERPMPQRPKMEMKSATTSVIDVSLPKAAASQSETQRSPARNRGDGEMDQQIPEATEKQAKETLGLKLLKAALAEYVKEVLKPAWKEGNINKDAYKAIVKKVVDKVSGSLQGHQIPRSQENVDQYMAQSQIKIAKLVQGYVEKFKKA